MSNDFPPRRDGATMHIVQFFEYKHLSSDLQIVSKMFCRLAQDLVTFLPDGPELTVALRKLLESKDAAVRAALFDTRTRDERPA